MVVALRAGYGCVGVGEEESRFCFCFCKSGIVVQFTSSLFFKQVIEINTVNGHTQPFEELLNVGRGRRELISLMLIGVYGSNLKLKEEDALRHNRVLMN